jgi:hypothetical protein
MSVGNPGDGRGDDETRDIVTRSTAAEPVTDTGWQAVADDGTMRWGGRVPMPGYAVIATRATAA